MIYQRHLFPKPRAKNKEPARWVQPVSEVIKVSNYSIRRGFFYVGGQLKSLAPFDLNEDLSLIDPTLEVGADDPDYANIKPEYWFGYISAPDADGNMQRWAVEWGGAGQLGSQGITSGTLRPGDEVIVVGNPGRKDGDFRVRMRSLRRTSDGFGWGQAPGEVFD